ncbi:5'-nucleotidase, lipoprotein e(P4) family [Mucilaginibacter phyllosphaerae]|uniref:5'-nucleotidase (Lipoprotein e(P4) family) n=1 Tax=Mucilaginibacter phyllosphaerae TaxID=1812349 RepID=A0A4Y8AM60_9SPHI|nr:5'-nucleotidase, lipoprotein e(P4) family [Mucilaginibacter phyllosphaerae]MBB3967492.1 5'-nucleotidase (lipoprotein e(P4) family) [Mucilaginibacter phyllosphaerae]TEW69441.1 5'-nucleotidase, lipoprotein e(P4) family [Mucilaginibacter phyllosphaerae]GGH21013.1 5'-nucleotidase [Mucilaginibacter phyllosphaerae]
MKKQFAALLAGTILFAACSTPKKTQSASIANNGKVWASLWQQRSAEYKALCYQAYNTARWRLDEALKNPGSKPPAIITDIDETVLDNSPYDAMRAANNQEFSPATWKAWTAKAVADTVPGAPAFLKYAASKGVTIFYITNRDEDERAATIKNLQLYNLPNADNAHLQLKQTTSSKETRRQQVLKKFNVVLLCGDNLPDFDLLYDNQPTEANREATTKQLMKEFGNKYIVLPNPSYGDFEGALFNYNYKLSGAQKDSVIRAKVKVDKQ